ncbi:hypothetical protein IGI04_035958 [Brassica rapa subsp. trilocularis]|uniref:Uncharacterized protein n=1 Tax=Brassica rapa subsp. trilocularis TaxID=1813537 RepID=A0ABQ7LD91_BRACM|nr:hypothetical protein IGI04_035958 [Brassica rapa subsp. trilocularis]
MTKTSRTLLGLLPLATPQKGPPLSSLLNPHRNAFRFVSIGVSVEILRRKQVGLFLACFHSLRSDLSDRPPLGSLLNPHRNAFGFGSIGVSVEILRRKQVGLFLARFHSLRSDLSDPQLASLRPFRLQKAPPLCSLLNPDRNAFCFVSIGVSVEILRQKQIRLLCILLQISIETSLVSIGVPLKLYDKKKTRKDFRLNYTITLNLFTKIDVLSKEKITSVKISMNIFSKSIPRKDIFTKSLAVKSCSTFNRTTKYDCPKATDMYQNRPRTSSSTAIGPQTNQARSIRGDQACTQLGRYVATERPSRSVAT